MTDDVIPPPGTSGVASDLGIEPSPPTPPPMAYAEATSRKAEFMADKAKVDALMRGDGPATSEWQMIVAGLSAQPPAPTGPREAETAYLDEIGGYTVPQDVLDEFQRGDPVSPRERSYAEAKFAEFQQDKEWYARWQRGEQTARVQYAALISILSRPVRDSKPQT
jgi:hypothetical protein